jgi:hypothetical protein
MPIRNTTVRHRLTVIDCDGHRAADAADIQLPDIVGTEVDRA